MTALLDSADRALERWMPADLTRRQKVTIVALVLIGAQLAFRAWAVYGGWFYGDDLEWLSTEARGGADLTWVFAAHDSQLMPLGLLLAKLVGSLGTFGWGYAATQIFVLQVGASLACWWMLRTLFGDVPRILLPLILYLSATATLPALMWWAVALNQLPLHITLFMGVAAHVQYLRTRRPRYLVLASLWLVFGFLSYVKTLLVVFVLVAVAVLYFAEGGALDRVRSALRRYRAAWVAYGTLTLAYLAVYVVHVPSPLANDGKVDYLGLADIMFRRSLGPTLLGGPWRWDDLNSPLLIVNTPEFFVSASWVVVIVAAGYLVLTRRRSARVGFIVLPYLAMTLYLVGEGRAYALGGYAGLELRYLADFAALVPLVVALMWLPLRGATESAERKDIAFSLTEHRHWVALGCAVLVGSSAVSSVQYVHAWHGDYRTRKFVDTARSAIAGSERQPVLSDDPVPTDVLGSQQYPWNKPSAFLAPIADQFTISDAANDVLTFDGDGHLAFAQVTGGIASEPERSRACGYLVKNGARVIPLNAKTYDFPFWMVLGYLSSNDGTVTVRAGENERTVPVEKGLHKLFVRTSGVYDRVELTPSAGVEMCVDRIRVGNLEAMK